MREEVMDFLCKAPLEPRHALRQAIKDLRHERGDIRALTDDLRIRNDQRENDGEFRLRRGEVLLVYEPFQSRLLA